MSYKPILIVSGEPNSIFSEIFIKSLKKIRIKNPIILICSFDLFKKQMIKLNLKTKVNIINPIKIKNYNLSNKSVNLVNINYHQKNAFQKISSKSNKYIEECFNMAFKIIKREKIVKFINGPISKKYFLKKKYLGMTEYISDNFSIKKTCMLIFNKKLSVSPITTHLPLKLVVKNLNSKKIEDNISLVQKFFKTEFNKKPKIGVLGVNPHCESILDKNEDESIIKPIILNMKKKGYKIKGPISADTVFLKKNRENYDVIIGMYHDQVLTPLKTLFEYDAINITLGLPFLRVSPDHGPNEKMMGKNLSNPLSLIQAIKFLDKN
ncbi:4-hydroxythreonine-4-phosphate dehydrogenase PdxA [Candidatus Pelagibacter sp. HIMB1593]|uniref:4-hydroxythreonine-4-phosphate dehydrogenase PdxA n=1 Tax=Candidatus Pelagibacter sp. HIMB1593 TaxID=3413355 RepID=UPI003F83C396